MKIRIHLLQSFKLAVIEPLIKKITLAEVSANYRPVSNLPFSSMIPELAVASQLCDNPKAIDFSRIFGQDLELVTVQKQDFWKSVMIFLQHQIKDWCLFLSC